MIMCYNKVIVIFSFERRYFNKLFYKFMLNVKNIFPKFFLIFGICGLFFSLNAQAATNLPDLTVTDISFSKSVQGEQGTLSVTVKNLGGDLTAGSGLGNWSNNFASQNFVYSAKTPSANAVQFGREFPTASNPLKTGESITLSWIGSFNTFGNLYLQFKTDNANELEEANENNNSYSDVIVISKKAATTDTDDADDSIKITETSAPDLTVTDISFSKSVQGEEGVLSVTIKNLGGDLTSGAGLENWYNNFSTQSFVYSAKTPSANSHKSSRENPSVSNPLKTGESVTFSWIGSFNTFGNLYLHFKTDYSNELVESNENNNSYSDVIVISKKAAAVTTNTNSTIKITTSTNKSVTTSASVNKNTKSLDDSNGNFENNSIILKLQRTITALETKVIELEKKLTNIDNKFAEKYSGTMFLDVENQGRLWYVDPASKNRFYFSDGDTALSISSELATGITDENLQKIPVGVPDELYSLADSDNDGLSDKLESALGSNVNNADTDGDGISDKTELENGYNPVNNKKYAYDEKLANRLEGKMLLQVSGENSHGEIWYVYQGKRWYGGTKDSMYEIMKSLSLGATAENIRKITVGEIAE